MTQTAPTLHPELTITETPVVNHLGRFAFLAHVPAGRRAALIAVLHRAQADGERSAADAVRFATDRLRLALALTDPEMAIQGRADTEALHRALRRHRAEAVLMAASVRRAFSAGRRA